MIGKWTEIRDAIEAFFVSHESAIVNFFKPFALALEKDGKQILIDAAMAAVTAAESTPGGGQAKMAAALAMIAETLQKEGVAYVESEARAAAELALQNLKAAAV